MSCLTSPKDSASFSTKKLDVGQDGLISMDQNARRFFHHGGSDGDIDIREGDETRVRVRSVRCSDVSAFKLERMIWSAFRVIWKRKARTVSLGVGKRINSLVHETIEDKLLELLIMVLRTPTSCISTNGSGESHKSEMILSKFALEMKSCQAFSWS